MLRRPADSRDLPKILNTPAKPRGPSKAALRRVEAAEQSMAEIEAEYAAATAALAADREALDAREAEEAERHHAARKAAERELSQARRAL